MTKASPNAGKSFFTLTVLISCGKNSLKAIQWMASIFHAYESQLTAQALHPKTGQVLPSYVKQYQNNMLLHLCAQMANTRLTHPPTHSVICSEQSPPNYVAQIIELCVGIAALHLEFEALQFTHKASPDPPPPTHPPWDDDPSSCLHPLPSSPQPPTTVGCRRHSTTNIALHNTNKLTFSQSS